MHNECNNNNSTNNLNHNSKVINFIESKFNHQFQSPFFGPLMVFLATGWWASDIIFRSTINKLLPNLGVTFWETLIGSLIFLPFIYIYRHEIRGYTKATWLGMMYCGFFAVTIANTFLNLIFGGVSYNLAGFFLTYHLQPIFTILSAYIILKEKPTLKYILFSALALVGIYLYNFSPIKTLNYDLDVTKNLFISGCGLIAAIIWGIATTIGKKTLNNANFLVVTGFRYIFGFIGTVALIGISLLLPSTIAKLETFEPINYTLTTVFGIRSLDFVTKISQTTVLFNILIIGIFASISMFVYYLGLNNTKARIATFAEMGYPIVSIVIYYLMENKWQFDLSKFVNSYSQNQWIGIALVLVSIFVISSSNREEI